MFTLKRISTTPDSPIRILVDQAQGDGDTGMALGGSFFFMPAGQEGDMAQVPETTARAILADPSLAVHFECTPALPEPVRPDLVQPDVVEAPPAGRRKGKG